MRKESLANKEKVYRAMLTEYKTVSDLQEELNMTGKAVQNHLRFLTENKLIRNRREDIDRAGVAFAYTACDSSDVYSFQDKLRFNRDGVPSVVGRCDFAASWIPKQTNYYEETV
jgi:predicted transcriptional regulator